MPGSNPRAITLLPRDGLHRRGEDFVADINVREDFLDVIEIFQLLDQADDLDRRVRFRRDRWSWVASSTGLPATSCPAVTSASRTRVKFRRLGVDDERLILDLDIAGSGVDRLQRELVRVGARRPASR